MISESARELIQQISQALYSDACETMRDRPWEFVEFQTQYDEDGGYVRNSQIKTVPQADELISLTLNDEIETSLQSLEEHRIDDNGKQWIGLSITISQAGEAKIQLAYAESDVGDAKE